MAAIGKTDRENYEDIALAIRRKLGVTTRYLPSELARAVGEIPTGKPVEQATPVLTLDSATGKVTATAEQEGGIVPEGEKTETLQLFAIGATTWTPGKIERIIPTGHFLTGDQTIPGEPNLTPPNIRKGTEIFGVTGTLQEGILTDDATATANDIRSPKTAYVKGEKVTGAMPDAALPTIELTVSNSGQIKAVAELEEGYVKAGTAFAVRQMDTQSGVTITPGTANRTISAYRWLTGAITILGDADLLPANIHKGTEIFGVTGTLESGFDTSDATATAANILNGKTAYINGGKTTGTMPSKAAQTYTPGTSNQTIAAGQYLSGAQTILGDADLIPDNIRKGVTIFNVTGTMIGGVDTSDATAFPGVIFSGYTAYVNGVKITGTYVAEAPASGSTGLIMLDFTSTVDALPSIDIITGDMTLTAFTGVIDLAGFNSYNSSTVDALPSITVLSGWY